MRFYLRSFLLFLLSISFINSNAQKISEWDNPLPSSWPEECQKVEIVSTIDGNLQPAVFYKATGDKPRPLVVSLHTWSGGYDQKDTLVWQCIGKNFNYIHPHFRGPNRTPEACGSALAIQDIDDAIAWIISNADVDMDEIHVIGASGGGYATLLAYMNSEFYIKTFSAWVPISDLVKWYYESEGRGRKYSRDIAMATVPENDFTEDYYYMDEEEAINRSPYYMATPVNRRKEASLRIFAGIHDGYMGSVPITQSIFIYNKILKDLDPEAKDLLVPKEDIIELLSSRNFRQNKNVMINDRKIHYIKEYANVLKLIIFEGRHEMLTEVALDHIICK
jgi:predicted peptidase